MHEPFTVLMSLVLDGEATPAEEARLREHLKVCRTCMAVWQQWQALDQHLTAAPVLRPPRDFMTGVTARLEDRRQRRRRSRWFGSGLLAAGGLIMGAFWLCVIGLAGWGWYHPQEVGVIVSVGAQLLSGLSWFLRGIGVLVHSLGTVVFAFGVEFYLCLTGGLGVLWLWVLVRGRGRAHGSITLAR